MPLKIIRSEKIYDAGRYHVWTDMVMFKGKYYLSFRSGTMHSSGDGVTEILQSSDTYRWRHCAKGIFKLGNECIPHLATTGDMLYLFMSCYWFDLEECKQKTRSVIFHTDNGEYWKGPFPFLPAGYTNWRPKYFNGCFYSTGYRATENKDDEWQVDLFFSRDGLTWELIHPVGEVDPRSNETELAFTPEGEMIALLRFEPSPAEREKDRHPRYSYLGRAKPPYREWKYTKVPYVAGPLLTWWNGDLYAIGRTYLEKDYQPIAPWDNTDRTMVYRLVGDRLERELILPSGGDSAYAGAVELENGNLLVSYYSSREFLADPNAFLRRSAIYLAELAQA